MDALSEAFWERMVGDAALASLLATYSGNAAVFTTDPAPGNAVLPYVVTAGQAVDTPFDTKTTRGRQIWRDVRCYAERDGSAAVVEAIAERVRELFHRHMLAVSFFETWIAECAGPIVHDEADAYGRIVTVKLVLVEREDS